MGTVRNPITRPDSHHHAEVPGLGDQGREVAVALDGVGLHVHVEEVVALAAGRVVDAQPVLLRPTTLGGGQLRNATSFFLWASLFSEPMPACSAALALGGGGIVRRIASPQAPALSSALGGSLVSLSS